MKYNAMLSFVVLLSGLGVLGGGQTSEETLVSK